MSKNNNIDIKWPAQNPVNMPTDSLIPYQRNARVHTEKQIGQIADAIREWGWTTPILVDEANGVIAGHGRLMAAKKLGIEIVPCLVAKGWSEDQKRAYVIADNQIALNAGWDDGLLDLELSSLDLSGFNLSLIGLDDPGEAGKGLEIEEIPVFTLQGRFWISVKGPFQKQAEALTRLKQVMEDLPEVEVEMGTIFNE